MMNPVPAPSSADHGGAPPLPHRRPRVREVSSRFMSPSPAGDLHSLTMKSPKHPLSTPAPDRSSKPSPSQRRLLLRSQPPAPESFSSSENIPETARSMETPFHYAKPEPFSTQTRQRAVKLFKENGYGDQIQIPKSSSVRTSKSSRPDTPSDRIVPSRFRLPHRQTSCQTSSSVTDAAKLLSNLTSSGSNNDSAVSISQTLVESQSDVESIKGGSCPNSPISSKHTRTWSVSDTSNSMTDENTLSNRLLVRSNSCSSTTSTIASTAGSFQTSSTPSLCTRSVNLPISGNHNFVKKPMENHSLPPQPAGTKPGVDVKKGKKHLSSPQEIHSLKMMHNRYMLWRYANAKAEASMHAQSKEMEKQFFSVGADISQLRDTVKKKQVELATLQRAKALSTILESQMPYLDEWPALEEDHTSSLSGIISALTNSLLRLPISGNVQVNVKEAAEALDSAVKTADMIVQQMQTFLPKAEELDSLMSDLASIADTEKALVEECGQLLGKTHTLQLEDCSLRGHLMQLSVLKQKQIDTFC